MSSLTLVGERRIGLAPKLHSFWIMSTQVVYRTSRKYCGDFLFTRLIIWVLTLSSGTVAFSRVTPQDLAFEEQLQNSFYVSNFVPFEQEMSFGKLEELIRDKNIRSVEELVGNLPFHMLDKNYVVMYRSRSLQAASPDSPRIITFTPSARFVLTYNGGAPGQKGSNAVETVQFHSDSNTFEFREIEFLNGEAPKISDPNPSKCMRCHQSVDRVNIDPRPNWEPYNVWPGAIGSFKGFQIGTKNEVNVPTHIEGKDPIFQDLRRMRKEENGYLKRLEALKKITIQDMRLLKLLTEQR